MTDPLLLLVRHGETESNVARRFAGWNDDRVSASGRRSCEGLAERLAGHGIDRIFSSPVRRAVETAGILAGKLDASVRTVHDLHELEIGVWKGHTMEEVREGWPDDYRTWRDRPDSFALEGRESLADLRERALAGLDRVGRSRLADPEAPAVVVSHLAVIRVLWLAARQRPLSEYHSVRVNHCEPRAVRWLGRGRVADAPRWSSFGSVE